MKTCWRVVKAGRGLCKVGSGFEFRDGSCGCTFTWKAARIVAKRFDADVVKGITSAKIDFDEAKVK